METSNGNISRRHFVEGAGALGVAGAIAASGVSAARADEGAHDAGGTLDENGRYVPSFMVAPEPYASWDEELDTDVVVVGLGLSGACATRKAMEDGARVVAIEKAGDFVYRSNQFGAINSDIHNLAGASCDDDTKQLIVTNFMRNMGWRPDQRIWKRWADESGEIFNWFVSIIDNLTLLDPNKTMAETGEVALDDPDNPVLSILNWPPNPEYDALDGTYPAWTSPAILYPNQAVVHDRERELFEASDNVELRFNTRVTQLIMQDGRAAGVFAEGADGKIIKVNAANGVIMACGDYASNTEMRDYYIKSSFRFPTWIWNSMDDDGNPTNDGSGLAVGLQAGAYIEEGEHSYMVHGFGGGLGCDPFLFVDGAGKRFTNEDISGNLFSTIAARAAGGSYWQIFDDNYPDQVHTMPSGHAMYWKVVDNTDDEPWGNRFESIGWTTRADVEAGCDLVCDTVEELAEGMGVPPATLRATIDRYNELAERGVDEDFGKRGELLHPIAQPPFYANQFTPANQMAFCALTGFWSDEEARVYDKDLQVIPGLYACGNAQGRRFSIDYPTTYMGISHGMAMTYGYIAGMNAAAKFC